jgi:hypothetical protein
VDGFPTELSTAVLKSGGRARGAIFGEARE